MNKLIRNALQTPDGTILESRYRHDYQTYTDTVNGQTYMVDGGLDYCRRSAMNDAIDLNVYIEDPHEKVRDALTWGTYGKDGKQPYSLVKLKCMSTDHIRACLENCSHTMYPQIQEAMKNELVFREGR